MIFWQILFDFMIVEMLLLVNCRQVNIQHQRLAHSCMLVFVFVYVFVFVFLFVPIFFGVYGDASSELLATPHLHVPICAVDSRCPSLITKVTCLGTM